jgi:protoporphyrinogen oxidase
MARKIISAVPGLKPKGSGRFFYPKKGFGQISESYYCFAKERGAEINLDARVESVEFGENGKKIVEFNKDDKSHSLQGDHIWSTIPITILAKIITPSPPQDKIDAIQGLDTRAMILIYLVLAQDRFSEYDAHYFPEQDIPITRLSEPKNYSNGYGPQNLTVLCAEFPCSQESPEWKLNKEELGDLVCNALEKAGIPITAPILEIHTRRLKHAYPIYRQGYETYFDHLDTWVDQIDGLLSFGRQGLFAHDNTHHALFMAYSAVKCLNNDGSFDKSRWHEYRKIFDTHVVED